MRTDCQEQHERAYDDYRIGIKKAIKTDTKSFFLCFEVQLASGSQSISDFFAEFIKQTYADDS
jgi:hypothetical protein